MVMY